MIQSSPSDLSIAGPELAGHAFRSRLVSEAYVFLSPIVVLGGKPAFASDLRVQLELAEDRSFEGRMIYLRYGARY